MSNTRWNILIALVALLLLCPAVSLPQESQGYIVTVGNEQIRFVPQSQAGYVVKLQDKPGGIGAFSSLSSLELAQATPIRGLDRKGVYVVERRQPAGENDKTITALGSHGQVKYAAPLFSCEGETVAHILDPSLLRSNINTSTIFPKIQKKSLQNPSLRR